jgi:hypothetical protein
VKADKPKPVDSGPVRQPTPEGSNKGSNKVATDIQILYHKDRSEKHVVLYSLLEGTRGKVERN